MIQALLDQLNLRANLSSEETDFLKANVEVKSFPKGSILLEAGSLSKEFFFVLKGCVRMYYSVEGEEKTAFFYTENEYISSYESFVHEVPAKHFLQCIEPCELIVVSRTVTYTILEQFPKFDFLTRVIQEEELILYQNLVATFVTLTPEQRYLNLLAEKPDWLQRISLHHLATYLGVTPETLSRIRKRVVSR